MDGDSAVVFDGESNDAGNNRQPLTQPGRIFIGGLLTKTTNGQLVEHFGKYGEITSQMIAHDKKTRLPRGFGYITFADPAVVDQVIQQTHVINGRQVEIRRATCKGSAYKMRELSHSNDAGNNRQPLTQPGRIYVGGLARQTTLDGLVEYFSKYGEITEKMIKTKKTKRNGRDYAFIMFADPAVADQVTKETHVIDGRQVTVNRATPKKDIRTDTISLTGIPFTMTQDDIRDFFTSYGEVKDIKLIWDHYANQNFWLIKYDSEEAVDDLLAMGNKIDFAGVQVEIKKRYPTKQKPPPPVLSSHSNDPRSSQGGGYDAYNGFDGNYGIVSYWPGCQFFRYGTNAGAMVDYRDPSLGYPGAMGAYLGDPSLGYPGTIGAYRGDPSLWHAGAIGPYRGDPSLWHLGAMVDYRDPSFGYPGATGAYRGDPSLGYPGASAIGAYRGDPSLWHAGAIGTYRGDPSLGHAGLIGAYSGAPSPWYAGGYVGDFGRGYVLDVSSGTSESYGVYGAIFAGAIGSSYNASHGGATTGQ